MIKKSLPEHIVSIYKALDNPWMCADDIRDALKNIHFVKSESVARCIRRLRDMFEEMKINNYKKFRLTSEVLNT